LDLAADQGCSLYLNNHDEKQVFFSISFLFLLSFFVFILRVGWEGDREAGKLMLMLG